MRAVPVSSVCIVGGGPAGLAAAIAISQANIRVTVVDHALPPIDKACGEGLMPDSVAVLSRLGVTVPAGVGARFRGIRFCDAQSQVAADFPNGSGFALRRVVLHELLVRRAAELGVTCIWGAKQIDFDGTRASVDGCAIESNFVVAADGGTSKVRRTCGLDETVREGRRYGFRRHFRLAPWSAYMDLHWASTCQVYVTPIAANEVCVVAMSRDPKIRLDDALSYFPTLQQRLRHAEPVTHERGAVSVSRTLRQVYNDNVALIGDASGSVDAITGEGLCLSFKQALSLADALKAGRLENYGAEHAALSRRPQMMGALLLSLDRHPRFRRRAIATLARHPKVFESLLAMHIGARSLSDLFSWELVHFCRSFLEA